MKKIHFLTMICALCAVMFACEEEVEPGTAKFQVKLIDAPADYEHVFIDVQDVRINEQQGDEGWKSLEAVERKVYDLLKLTNGEEAMLADVELPVGKVNQIRLVLGSNNSVVVDKVNHRLDVPSGAQSGLKLNLNLDLKEGVTYEILLDFDAARSVHQTGNGQYMLKPVVRAILEAQSGSIKGSVKPAELNAVVYCIDGQDSLATYPDNSGTFLFRGVEPGSYSISIVPDEASGYMNQMMEGVRVTLGEVTELDAVDYEAGEQ